MNISNIKWMIQLATLNARVGHIATLFHPASVVIQHNELGQI